MWQICSTINVIYLKYDNEIIMILECNINFSIIIFFLIILNDHKVSK